MKDHLIKIAKLKFKIPFTGFKEIEKQSVHNEIETTESGRYFASGDEYNYVTKEKWLYILGVPIIRTHQEITNKIIFNKDG